MRKGMKMTHQQVEKRSVQYALQHWRALAGCGCRPRIVPEGKGYDLECRHLHVELKGTGKSTPGFRYLTRGEFDAARRDPLFKLWLVAFGKEGETAVYIIPRDKVLELAKLEIQWQLKLGKERLQAFKQGVERGMPGKRRKN